MFDRLRAITVDLGSQVGGGSVARTAVGLLHLTVGETGVTVNLEQRRARPRGLPRWHEAHRLTATDGRYSLFAQLALHPDRAAVAIVVGGLGPHPLVIVDDELPVPDQRWEFRSPGIWVEFVCESPMVHWSYGLEAFALALDDRRELLNRGYGRRVPLGWELDFTATAEPDVDHTTPEVGSYHQAGTVEGLLLDDGGQYEVGPMVASRHHWWGETPEPTGADGDQADAVALPTPAGVLWVVP